MEILNFSDFAEFDFLAIRIFNWRNSKMKKTLIAMAVLGAASGVAMAANVTMYGLIETGVSVSKITEGGKDAIVQMTSGFDSGPRWGIKGVEELGNGYNVGFILEQGFNSDNGNEAVDGKAFSREAILYVDGSFGSLAFGHTGALSFAQSRNIRTGWVFGTGYGAGAWNSIDFIAKRMNDVVSYASPKIGGFTIHAMYSNAGSNENAKDDAKWSKNGHYYGLGVLYNANNIKSSLIFEATQNKNGEWNKDTKKFVTEGKNLKAKYGINYGLEWNLGSITPMFAYQYIWQDGGNKDHQFGLSAAAPLAGGTVKVGARYTFGKDDGATAGEEDKHRAFLVGAAYEYPFSKRTMLKTYAGYADGSKGWAKVADNYGINGYQIFAGLQHKF